MTKNKITSILECKTVGMYVPITQIFNVRAVTQNGVLKLRYYPTCTGAIAIQLKNAYEMRIGNWISLGSFPQ